MAGVSLRNVTLGYDTVAAIRDLDADVSDGSLTAIVGPNGAGKSTLLRGISGELLPLSGHITRHAPNPRDIAYLPQQSSVDRSFPITVKDFVSMGLWHQVGPLGGIGSRYAHDINRAIEAVGLRGLEGRSIGALSGGQMQRVMFARLLLQDAKLVLLDEPFTAIDATTTADLLNIVRGWHWEGRTVLAVLHDHDLVRSHFPKTLMVARDLVAHGDTAKVLTSANLLKARRMCEACDRPPEICEHKFAGAA
ncbi:MAG: metal ABC transporter ATP-binding protein [Pseudomonadota bacterium]